MSAESGRLGATPASVERRGRLLAWMRERRQHEDLTTQQIVSLSGIYSRLHMYYPADVAGNDLKYLERQGLVVREGRPARWKTT